MTRLRRATPEKDVEPTEVGLLIRSLRESSTPKIPQEELAFRTGFTQSRLSKIERGVTKRPAKEDLRAIAKALGADPDVLFIAADYTPDRVQRTSRSSDTYYQQLWYMAKTNLPAERVVEIEAEVAEMLERHEQTSDPEE